MVLKVPGSRDFLMPQSLLCYLPKNQRKKIIKFGQIIQVRILFNRTLNGVSKVAALYKKRATNINFISGLFCVCRGNVSLSELQIHKNHASPLVKDQ